MSDQATPLGLKSELALKAALLYAERGWPVVPCYVVQDSRCSCMKGAECRSPGKHPRSEHGFKDATTDPEQIKRWAAKFPGTNGTAARTWRPSGDSRAPSAMTTPPSSPSPPR